MDGVRLLADVLGTAVHTGSDDGTLSARVDDPEPVSYALAALTRAGVEVTTFALRQPSLDEVFLTLTGHPATAHQQEEQQP